MMGLNSELAGELSDKIEAIVSKDKPRDKKDIKFQEGYISRTFQALKRAC